MAKWNGLTRATVIAGAAGCWIITVIVWRAVGAQQSIWPFPGLYFIELMALAAVAVVLLSAGSPATPPLLWAAAGVYSIFAVLGAWTIGLLYAPTAILFLLAGVATDLPGASRLPRHALMSLGGAVVQGAAMLLLASTF